eukprot:g3522.t1
MTRSHEFTNRVLCWTGLRVKDPLFETQEDFSISAPKQIEISLDCSVQETEKKIQDSGLCFPLVVKPKWTDGSDESHLLAVVRDRAGLELALDREKNIMKPPFVAQQFVEHNSVLFKVYVIGKKVVCCSRPSLDLNRCLLSFQLLPRISSKKKETQELVELPPEWLTKQVAFALKEKLQLELFNFDLIKQQGKENVYFIVDINYFPGIDKLSGFEDLFVDFLINVCENTKV